MNLARRAAVLLATLSCAVLVVPATATAHPADPSAAKAPAARTAERVRHCANGRPSHNYGDRVRDSAKGIDITTLSVWNKDADRCDWTTVSGYFDKNKAQVFQAYYDTLHGRSGWEYEVFAYSKKDHDSRTGSYLLKKVKGGLQYVKCPVYSFFEPAKHQIGMGVPRSCLGNPGHVRVRVALYDITKYKSGNRWYGQVDQAPQKGFTPLY